MPTSAVIARRLGGPRTRRRRHRRVALAAGGLLVVALGLFVLGGDDDGGGFDDDATAVCQEFAVRVQDEFLLSFPDGVPSDAAFAEYTSHAFADTIDELMTELSALEPPAAVAEILDGYRGVLAELRVRPQDFVTENPFAAVAADLDTVGLPACGTDFFAASATPE